MTKVKVETPGSLEELKQCLHSVRDRAFLLAGGTDLVIKLSKHSCEDVILVDLSGIKELNYIKKDGNQISIGACTTFSQLAEHRLLKEHGLGLAEAASQMGSVQIRNRATIGGNIANASPAADSLPALVVLDAVAVVMDKDGKTERVPVSEIPAAPGHNSLRKDQVICQISFPIRPGCRSHYVKLGSRKTVTIARLNAAICAEYTGKNTPLRQVKIGLGALGPHVVLAHEAANFLEHTPLGPETGEEMAELLAREVDRAIPGRYSLPYKREAVKGLAQDLLRPFLDLE